MEMQTSAIKVGRMDELYNNHRGLQIPLASLYGEMRRAGQIPLASL